MLWVKCEKKKRFGDFYIHSVNYSELHNSLGFFVGFGGLGDGVSLLLFFFLFLNWELWGLEFWWFSFNLWVNCCFCQSVKMDHFLRGYVLLGTQNKNGSSLIEYLNARCIIKYSQFLNRVINLFCDSRDRAFLFLASVMISMPLSTYFYINDLLPAKSSTLHSFFSSPYSPEITCFLFISVSI